MKDYRGRASNILTKDICSFEKPFQSKKRILMLGPLPPTVGGITTFIEGVLESDLSNKYSLILFGTERPTIGLTRKVAGYTLMFHIGSFPLIKSAFMTLLHILKFPFVLVTIRPDIVHIHTASYWSFWENSVYSCLSKMLRRKVIIHIHGGLFLKFYGDSNIFVKFLIREILNIPDKIIVLSQRDKRLLTAIEGVQSLRKERIVVLKNFVDLSKFAGFDRRLSAQRDGINVLFVGGVGAKTKGLYDVLKAIPIVTKESKKVFFLFVACNDIEKKHVLEDKDIYSQVEFLDYVTGEKKIEIFRTADIFVLPSYFEAFPITILEAMAAGLPIIATSVGSIPEVIEEQKNGFLIETGDYHSLADRILLLAKDAELRLEMGMINSNKIRENYDRTKVLKKLGNLYDQLLDNYT